MTAEDCIAELAPAVVVRSALFPMRTLLGLADSEVAALAARTDARAVRAFEEAYEASIERQRRTLFAATIDDARFSRALCLTNDDLSRQILHGGSPLLQRKRRARRVDATLYRYLARAVWRTEPCDLWAGVTLAGWGAESCVRATRARYGLSPDLRPYQFIVQSLARTREYVERGIYKLNPTLKFDEARGCWQYTVRNFSAIVHCERPSSAGVDALLRAMADMQPGSLAAIAADCRRLGAADGVLDALMALVDMGLLVGGLAMPRLFSSPWDALMAVPRELRDDHARSWRSAIVRLRRVCRRVERSMDTIPLAELHGALDEARDIPVALARALDVDRPPLPRSVVRCDTSLPFSIAFGPAVKAYMAKAVAEYDLFERYHGIDAAARAAHRTLMLRNPDGQSSNRGAGRQTIATQESAWRAAGADPVLGERLRRWSRWLDEAHGVALAPDELHVELPPPPVGGLIVRPRRQGYEIVGSTTEIGATYGRYGQLWYGLGQRSRQRFESHPLHTWYRATLAKVARAADVEIVEYAGPCEAMPNGLARPRFGFPVWDRWGTTSRYRADQLHVDANNRAGIPLAHAEGRPRPIALSCFSPVNLGFSEPYLECLLLSSFREIPAWLGPGLPMACELAREEPSRPLMLPSGNTIRLRRTVVHGQTLKEFVTGGRAARFLLWQALARKHSWPALVLVARDGGPPLPVVRDSPLALEAALHGLREDVRFLAIEEPDDHAWISDEQGKAFAAEFIVPFLRRSHAWTALAAS